MLPKAIWLTLTGDKTAERIPSATERYNREAAESRTLYQEGRGESLNPGQRPIYFSAPKYADMHY